MKIKKLLPNGPKLAIFRGIVYAGNDHFFPHSWILCKLITLYYYGTNKEKVLSTQNNNITTTLFLLAESSFGIVKPIAVLKVVLIHQSQINCFSKYFETISKKKEKDQEQIEQRNPISIEYDIEHSTLNDRISISLSLSRYLSTIILILTQP